MKDYLSYSQLKAFAKSPNHYLAYLQEKSEPSPSMILGLGLHAYLLTPEIFADQYAVAEKYDRRTTEGKRKAEEQEELLKGKTLLTADQLETIHRMSEAILKSRHAEQILQQGEGREIEKFGEIAGMRFRAFADILSSNFVADLKSCQDASPEGFMRAAFNQDYHLQAAIYRELFGCPRFFWIAAESSSPWNVQIYEQSEDAALLSRDRLYRLIERFKDWDGQPEGYSSRILHLDLPRWAQ